MNLSNQEPIPFAIREAQLILADYDLAGRSDAEKTLFDLRQLLNRSDVVEAVD